MGSSERMMREKAQLREKVLDAAWEIFAQEGYEAATVRRIAKRIEYSPTAIYFHFGDKASLIKAVCDRESLRLAKRMAPLAKIPNPSDRIRAIAQKYVEFAKNHPNEYLVMFIRPRPPIEGLQEHPHRGNPETDAYALLIQAANELIAELNLDHDPHIIAQAVWGAVHGPVALHLVKEQEQWVEWRALDTVVEFLVDCILRGLEKEGKNELGPS